MIEPRLPKFQWGMKVRAVGELVNDGTFPEAEMNAVLVPDGGLGEIVNVGAHPDSNTPIYLVEFGEHLVVGCFEEEITPV
jgi:nitrogen fixation protein NifZ